MGIGAWCLFFDGMIVYSIGALEIGFGLGMLQTRFGFTDGTAAAVALAPYIAAAVS
jgi:hypothetical protein